MKGEFCGSKSGIKYLHTAINKDLFPSIHIALFKFNKQTVSTKTLHITGTVYLLSVLILSSFFPNRRKLHSIALHLPIG